MIRKNGVSKNQLFIPISKIVHLTTGQKCTQKKFRKTKPIFLRLYNFLIFQLTKQFFGKNFYWVHFLLD